MKNYVLFIMLLLLVCGFSIADSSVNCEEYAMSMGGSSSTVGNPPVTLGLANDGGLSDGSTLLG